MCGRFSLFAPRNDVAERFGATFVEEYVPSYNVAPSEERPIIPDVAPDSFRDAEWGLVPPWADERDDGGGINARAETVAEKPSFRSAFRGADTSVGEWERSDDSEPAQAGRCLVPADGFYEWGDAGDGRRPHRVEVDGGRLFAMAGLWTRWTPTRRQSGLGEFAGEAADDATVHTFAIITTAANDAVGRIHDRMPVILSPDEERRWLTADTADPADRGTDGAEALLDPYHGETSVFPVSEAVNDPTNDSSAVVEHVEG